MPPTFRATLPIPPATWAALPAEQALLAVRAGLTAREVKRLAAAGRLTADGLRVLATSAA
jgi:hypothetical protein